MIHWVVTTLFYANFWLVIANDCLLHHTLQNDSIVLILVVRFWKLFYEISQLIALWYIIYKSCKNFNYRTLEALNSLALIHRVYRKYMWHENMFQEDITVLVVFRPSKRSFCCRTPIQATFNVGFKMGLNLKLWTSYFTIQTRNSINSSDPLLRNLNNKMILFPLFLSLSLSQVSFLSANKWESWF